MRVAVPLLICWCDAGQKGQGQEGEERSGPAGGARAVISCGQGSRKGFPRLQRRGESKKCNAQTSARWLQLTTVGLSRLQQQAIASPSSVEQQVSAQRSTASSLHPPYNVEEHEQLQHEVQELKEWQARHEEQMRAKDEENRRISEQYRFEHARLQAQHDAAAALAKEEQGAREQMAAVSIVSLMRAASAQCLCCFVFRRSC